MCPQQSKDQPSLKMEAPQREGITNKEKRNNTLSSGGRGGGVPIAGLVFVGGALAVTSLIAVASFVTNRHKNKPSPQHSTANHDNACLETSNTTKDQVLSCESLPSQTSILEDKPDLKVESCVEEERVTSVQQEIMLSDDSPPESTVSFNDNETGEEGTESSAESPCFDEVDQSELQEPPKPIEIKEGRQEDDSATSETDEAEDDIVEEDEDVGFETSENSSEATGRISMDSSEAGVWPAELIEEEPQRIKGGMVNDQIEAEGTAKSNISRTFDQSHSSANVSEFSGYAGNDRVMASAKANSSEKPTLYAALNYYLSVTKLKTSAILLLLFAMMLLVLITHRSRISGSSTVAIL